MHGKGPSQWHPSFPQINPPAVFRLLLLTLFAQTNSRIQIATAGHVQAAEVGPVHHDILFAAHFAGAVLLNPGRPYRSKEPPAPFYSMEGEDD
jgi:hypothetical protein